MKSKQLEGSGGAVVVNMGGHFIKKRRPPPFRLLLVCLVLAALAGAAGYFFLRDDNTEEYVPPLPTLIGPSYYGREVELVASEALTQAKSGAVNEAVSKITDYLASNSVDGRGQTFLLSTKAYILFNKAQDKQAAIVAALAAIEASPQNPFYYVSAGDYYYQMDQKPQAKQYYQEALRIYDTELPSDYMGPDRGFYVTKSERQ